MFKRFIIVLSIITALGFAAANWFYDLAHELDAEWLAKFEVCEAIRGLAETKACLRPLSALIESRNEYFSLMEISLVVSGITLALMLVSGIARWIWKGQDK